MTTRIFDMDGVLLDSMPLWEHLGEDFLKRHGKTPSPDFRKKILAMSMPQAAEYLQKEFGIPGTIPEIIHGIDRLGEEFYTRTAPLKPGIIPVLQSLQKRGERCVVATATDRPLAEAALLRTGIREYFPRIYTCTELGLPKSQPECFEKILSLEGIPAEDAVVVEDSLHAIRSARAAGIRVLAIYDEVSRENWPEIQRCATRAIRAWDEF